VEEENSNQTKKEVKKKRTCTNLINRRLAPSTRVISPLSTK